LPSPNPRETPYTLLWHPLGLDTRISRGVSCACCSSSASSDNGSVWSYLCIRSDNGSLWFHVLYLFILLVDSEVNSFILCSNTIFDVWFFSHLQMWTSSKRLCPSRQCSTIILDSQHTIIHVLVVCRYGTYKIVQKMPGGEKLTGFTRILHRVKPDECMDEVSLWMRLCSVTV
jgi:hypothetical protein